MKPAARTTDTTTHGSPLIPGPGAVNVLIGYMPAWRGVFPGAAAGLQAAKTVSDIGIKTAEAATAAATGPALPVAKAAEEATKAAAAVAMGAAITAAAAGADINMCPVPLPIPPHGPGVVLNGSTSVQINYLPAARMGDEILEAVGPPNKVAMGCTTVLVGG